MKELMDRIGTLFFPHWKSLSTLYLRLDPLPPVDGDDRLLVAATVPVALMASLVVVSMNMPLRNVLASTLAEQLMASSLQTENLYPVLVDQAEGPEARTVQVRALSDKEIEGTGGITREKGFHTLTQYDTFQPGNHAGSAASAGSGRGGDGRAAGESSTRPSSRGEGQTSPQNDTEKTSSGQSGAGEAPGNPGRPGNAGDREFMIPTNYRFRQDFAFRYDGASTMSVATTKMAGYTYFRNMLRTLQETFAPPGINYAYRDFAGTVLNQPIKPQMVKVLFSIDDDGYIRDVRVVESMGQTAVDQACVDVLANHNFGKPPPEIFEHGHIFGINFIFPPVFNR